VFGAIDAGCFGVGYAFFRNALMRSIIFSPSGSVLSHLVLILRV
jgi:hypothetical protein